MTSVGTWVGPVVLAAAGSAAPAPAAINWWAWDAHRPPMGWFLGDFVLFLALVVAAGVRPLRQVLAERHATIKRSIAAAALAHAEAVRAQKDSRDKLAGVHGEAQAWLQESRADGERERDRLIAQAQARAAASEADVRTMIEQESRRAQERLRAELAGATVALARRRLRETLDGAGQARLNEAAIARLEADTAPLAAGRR